jgi:hypothetical protein
MRMLIGTHCMPADLRFQDSRGGTTTYVAALTLRIALILQTKEIRRSSSHERGDFA